MLPTFMSRLNAIREVLLPVPEDILKEALYHAGSNVIPLDSETELCRNHSNFMFESFLNFDLWALRMVDASSKLPSGVLDGHIMDIGNYDQCLSVEAPEKLFRGQMCIVETKGFMPDTIDKLNPERPFLKAFRIDLMFAVCVPSSCTAQDVKTHLNVALNSINATAIVSDSSCSSSVPVPLDVKEWIVIFLIALIVILVILSTVYENSIMGSEKNTLLCAFSLSSNCRHMLSTQTSHVTLDCLNGLRILAMIWVIAGHRITIMLNFPVTRLRSIVEEDRWANDQRSNRSLPSCSGAAAGAARPDRVTLYDTNKCDF
ncbi:hypothetical protein J6590_041546 [Homalodisca vitripennis]|nr:hypothetical protein J6590_041546 [Homalodisca vitripennis]